MSSIYLIHPRVRQDLSSTLKQHPRPKTIPIPDWQELQSGPHIVSWTVWAELCDHFPSALRRIMHDHSERLLVDPKDEPYLEYLFGVTSGAPFQDPRD